MAFIPILVSNRNLNNTEAALNYFLIQAFASTVLLFSIILLIIYNNYIFINLFYLYNIPIKLIILALIIKLGAAPFHFWFPNVIENINWINGILLITWQKIAPILILSYFIKLDIIFIIFVLLSTFIGAMGGLNQISLRKLIAFSSINHLGWIFIAIIYNENIWIIYFIIYSFINFCLIYLFKIFQIFYLNQLYSIFIENPLLKFTLLISILSLGGLPPFLGFIPKWLIIQSLSYINLNLINLFIIIISLITLFYYLKIRFSAFMINYNELIFFYKNFFFNKNLFILTSTNFFSLVGFFFIIDLIYF